MPSFKNDPMVSVTDATNTPAVTGISSTMQGIGVYGQSAHLDGVQGKTTADGHAGVAGVSAQGNGFGVYGHSEKNSGVVGYSVATGASGVVGVNDDGNGAGVYGRSKRASGVYGESASFNGVHGRTTFVGHAGVAGVSDTNAGTGVYGESTLGVGVQGKGGHLAGLFEGNVEITGGLVVQGVPIQALLQRIQQLEQRVAALAQHPGPVSPPPPSSSGAVILATLELEPSSGLNARRFRVTGSGFQSGEHVTLQVTYRAAPSQNGVSHDWDTTADSAGRIDYSYSASCDPAALDRPSWEAVATGVTSGKRSNVSRASC